MNFYQKKALRMLEDSHGKWCSPGMFDVPWQSFHWLYVNRIAERRINPSPGINSYQYKVDDKKIKQENYNGRHRKNNF